MNYAIIVAAGQGTRAGGSSGQPPKQFREIARVPLIIHTLRRFEQSKTVGAIIAVVPAAQTSDFLQLAETYRLGKLAHVVAGGQTRTASVWRGLQAVRAATAEVVAIHDGVRPFVTPVEIDRTIAAAHATGAAVLAVPAVDTIKEVRDGTVVRTCERSALYHALTPQCFRYEVLRRAYEQALAAGIEATDDSALVERLGAPVAVVEGSARNIKITRPEDFRLAEMLLRDFTTKQEDAC